MKSLKYKPFIVIPLALLIFSVATLVNGYAQTGEWFLRGIDLKGGTAITIPGSAAGLDAALGAFEARVREVGGFAGPQTIIEIPEGENIEDVLAALQQAGIPTEDASIHTIGSSLGENFWVQAQFGIAAAFILMGIVVFFLLRKPITCVSVIFAAFTDIVATLAFMQIFSIPLSLAGLAALLMLIGYSVDTDILLASRMFRGEGSVAERLRGALITGMTMTLTTLGALAAMIIIGVSPVITQIATVLLIGLVVDIATTWLMNALTLRWYMERRGGM